MLRFDEPAWDNLALQSCYRQAPKRHAKINDASTTTPVAGQLAHCRAYDNSIKYISQAGTVQVYLIGMKALLAYGPSIPEGVRQGGSSQLPVTPRPMLLDLARMFLVSLSRPQTTSDSFRHASVHLGCHCILEILSPRF